MSDDRAASAAPAEPPKQAAFEWWMVSNFAVGAGFAAFVALLIPPYVTEVTGSAADAGIVMMFISLAAVLAPVIGNFADRYSAHRIVLTLGVAGMGVAFAMYGLSAQNSAVLALDALIMGVSIAAQQAVAPVFVIAAGLDQGTQAKRLTTLNLVYPAGQVVGGALLAIAASASLGYSERFWIAAAFMVIGSVITWFGSAKAAKRIQASPLPSKEQVDKTRKSGLKAVLLSTFGLYLAILILSSITNNGINNQIANILPNVYGIDAATTSALIALAGLLGLAFYPIAGWLMARRGGLSTFTIGAVMRLVGSLAMAILGLVSGSPILLVAAAMQTLYQASPFIRMAQPVVAVRFSTFGAGAAAGWVIGASAVGSAIGSLLGGWLAQNVGFNAINWMGVISAGLSVVLLIIYLWPAERRKRDEDEPHPDTEGKGAHDVPAHA
jgi:predicted MFS family arabinose efflux permease